MQPWLTWIQSVDQTALELTEIPSASASWVLVIVGAICPVCSPILKLVTFMFYLAKLSSSSASKISLFLFYAYAIVLACFSVSVVITITKRTWRGKGLFRFTTPGYTPSLREVRAGMEAEMESETMEDYCLLACFQATLFHYISHSAQTYRGPQPSYRKWQSRKYPTDMTTGQSGEGSLSVDPLELEFEIVVTCHVGCLLFL